MLTISIGTPDPDAYVAACLLMRPQFDLDQLACLLYNQFSGCIQRNLKGSGIDPAHPMSSL